MSRRLLFSLALGLAASACQPGRIISPPGATTGTPPGPGAGDAGIPCGSNAVMMQSLGTTCAPCHSQGPVPFFASLAAFNNLLVNNSRYVVPGHPEQSYLVQLLQGTATGTFKQMPISGSSFAQLAAAGQTAVSVQDVESWITSLAPSAASAAPNPGAPSVSRQSAEQVRATLYAQLGLSQDDFFTPPAIYFYQTLTVNSLTEDDYPVFSGDEPDTCSTTQPVSRHGALGGSQTLNSKTRDLSASPPFGEALVPISQRYCKMAIAKAGNTLLFPYVSPTVKSATGAADIQKNIAYLQLHFLGDPATDADVQDIFTNVFQAIEATSDPQTAWAGVCSYFIRHPKWVFF